MADDKNNNTEQLRARAADLLSQANAKLSEIQQALASVGAGPSQSGLTAAAAHLSDVAATLSQALNSPGFTLRAADLTALESVLRSGQTSTLVAEATAQAGMVAARQQEVVAASAETRQETTTLAHDVFDRHIFDTYLRFSSPEDEAAYRKREADAKKYIDEQLAKKTPEGNLNAGGGMIGQMLDANVHGAGASPEFMPRWNALSADVEHQHTAMRAAGQSTAEFDRNLDSAARRFLKAKGLSDAQIDAALASGKDLLLVVKPYLGNDRDSQRLERAATASVGASPADRTGLPATSVAAASMAAPSRNVASIADSLKAAGVQMAADPSTGTPTQMLPGAKAQGRIAPGLPA